MTEEERKEKFVKDLGDCHIAWIEYAEARFGVPAKARMNGEELKRYHKLKAVPTEYPTYEVELLPEGWLEAHDHFEVAFLTARGHKLNKNAGNWHTWES